jgi:TetR/AcrR family transcriptional regulator, tetracycline repressor protein
MKVNREILARGALKLLNEVGLEQLTLRRLGVELKIQPAAMYWHFKSKEELLDEMATMVLAEAAPGLVPTRRQSEWKAWVVSFGEGLRKTLLRYRDGARVVAGTRLTNTEYMKTAEAVGSQLVEAGFGVRQTVVLLSTVYNYTLSFVMEEQAVFPVPGKRSDRYDIRRRNAQLAGEGLPLLRQAGPILFDRFERRYKEGLDLILQGAASQLQSRNSGTRKRERLIRERVK